MELKLLEATGINKNSILLMNDSEYAYICGSQLIVRFFDFKGIKEIRTLRADRSGFSAMDYNYYHNILIVVEEGIKSVLKIYSYLNDEPYFKLQNTIEILDAIDIKSVQISRDGKKFLVLCGEPLFILKIFEIKDLKNVNEILIINFESAMENVKFNPQNANLILMYDNHDAVVYEIKDSFPSTYESKLTEEALDEKVIRNEEQMIEKRFLSYHFKLTTEDSEIIDIIWDAYSNLYLAESIGLITVYDYYFNPIIPVVQNMERPNVNTVSPPICMLLTQKYVYCALENGKLMLINIFIPDYDIKNCTGIGNPDNYRHLEVEKELNILNEEERVLMMRYDYSFKKIVTVTKSSNIYILHLQSEIMLKGKEKDDQNYENILNIDEVVSYNDLKFHNSRIIGLKELGTTTQYITVSSKDQKIIFWEITDLRPRYTFYLEYKPTTFEVDYEGNVLLIGSKKGVLRIYDISPRDKNRNNLRLIFQKKLLENKKIDKIIVTPGQKYIIFTSKGSDLIFILSGDLNRNFQLLGYIHTKYPILDIAYHDSSDEILVLVKNLLFSYKVDYSVENKKNKDFMINFHLKYDKKARKVDSDLNIMIHNPKSQDVWLTGKDKYLRHYPLPEEKFEKVIDNKYLPPETPIDEIRAHDLSINCGMQIGNSIITGAKDGTVQIRENKILKKEFRSHSFLKKGISALHYSQQKGVVFVGGFDGSIFLLLTTEENLIPIDVIDYLGTNALLEGLDTIDTIKDQDIRNFKDIFRLEHIKNVNVTKMKVQSSLKTMLEDIKKELNKLIQYNSSLEDIEQLKPEEIIINQNRIDSEIKEGTIECANVTRKYYLELIELEIRKIKLLERTFFLMTEKDESGKLINNNMRVIANLKGDKFLKSYPVRRISEEETIKLNYVKQLRTIELNEKLKRKNENLVEFIDENKFSYGNEEYIINRKPGKISLVEIELKNMDVDSVEADGGGHGHSGGGNDKRSYKSHKYKLQQNPYENENMKNNKNDDNQDQIVYKADEQLLKEDLNIKFKSSVTKEPEIEFVKNIVELASSSLLYSPFELYTNFRMRNQIILLMDIIHQLKISFNKDFVLFITEKNAIQEKIASHKGQIEALKDILKDINTDMYNFTVSKYEDSDYINKIDEGDLRVDKYFSKEEKKQREEEIKREEERLKALQGDTMETRGLKTMLDGEPSKQKNKQNVIEEAEIPREAFMTNKKKDEWTDEEMKKYNEYIRKEKELSEKKAKIKSQAETKLANLKGEIEGYKMDIESKMQKIFKKKLYTDYLICQEELYILSMVRTLHEREVIKKHHKEIIEKRNKVQVRETDSESILKHFEEKKKIFDHIKGEEINFTEKDAKLKDKAKILHNEVLFDLDAVETTYLKQIRPDPYYFFDRDKMKYAKKYGNKTYKEFDSKKKIEEPQKITENEINAINNKLYYEYKRDQYRNHHYYLQEQYNSVIEQKTEIEREFQYIRNEYVKSKLNFSFLIKISKGQDETSDDNGPQNYIDDAVLIDKTEVDILNDEINKHYTIKKSNMDKAMGNQQNKDILNLELIKSKLNKHDTELKNRYLKLTRVTKKIQEIVTGREQINQEQIRIAYEQKKKNLNENKKKRIETLEKKMKETRTEIDKKKKENYTFRIKLAKLMDSVALKQQIIDLDADEKDNNKDELGRSKKKSLDPDYIDMKEEATTSKKKNKALEIAEVTKLKNLVQQHYEEIEFLRNELDKLRARTFPSFLQKPDHIIYPDEK